MNILSIYLWYLLASVLFVILWQYAKRIYWSRAVNYLVVTLVSLVMAIPLLLRNIDELKNDYVLYISEYQNMETIGDLFNSRLAFKADYLFFLPQLVFNHFHFNSSVYFGLLSYVSIWLLVFSYSTRVKSSGIFFISFCAISSSYFYLLMGNVLRQGLVLSIVILVLFQRRLIPLLLGLGIHKSVLILFPLFRNYRPSLLLPLYSLILGYVGVSFLELIPIYGAKMSFYLSDFIRSSDNGKLKLIMLLLYMFFIYWKFVEYDLVHRRIFLLGCVVLLFWKIDPVFSRLIYYVDIFVGYSLYRWSLLLAGHREIKVLALCFVVFAYGLYVISHPSVVFNLGI